MKFLNWINKKTRKINTSLSVILKFLLFVSVISSVYYNLWHMMSISLLLLLLLFLPQLIKKSHKIKIPKEFEFLLLIFVIIAFFSRKISSLVTPIFFGIAMGFFGFLIMLILYSNGKIKKDPLFISLFAFCFSVTTGFLIELSKYCLKFILKHTLSDNIYIFTMNLMISVTLGSIIASVIGYFYMRGRISFFKKIIEMFEKSNPNLHFRKKNTVSDVENLLEVGESGNLEFKSTLRKNLYTQEIDKKVEYAVLKTINAFLNSEGGILLIGVGDKGEIIGIDKDNFSSNDKFLLHFTNLIKEKIGKKYISLINFELVKIKNKFILEIRCARSKSPVFLKEEDNENFYIRIGPASTRIEGSNLIEYIDKKFNE